MMPEGDGLRGLQMGESRHHGRRMFLGAAGQRMLEGGQRRICYVDRVADIEPEIGRHLIVAGARGVQPSRRGPNQFGEPALDIHMDVFERALEVERALADF